MYAPLEAVKLSNDSFKKFVAYIKKVAGIHLNDTKRVMVETRLQKRLKETQSKNFEDYLAKVIASGSSEKRYFIDALTTNETYFYREPVHFEFLGKLFKNEFSRKQRFACWSAASSYGHEAYSVAMEASEAFPFGGWKIFATDISQSAIERAQEGEFDPYEYRLLPDRLRKKYTHSNDLTNAGYLAVDKKIQERVSFTQANLLMSMPFSQRFDLIFLRNVLIYFEMENKIKIINNVIQHLNPGGYLFISISEAPLSREICGCTPLKNLGKGIFHLPE